MFRETFATMAVGAVGVAGVHVAFSDAALAAIPERAAVAYMAAAEGAPCPVAPADLAAIYELETGHGTHGGATADPETGVVSPQILGPRLDGRSARIGFVPDSDGGRWDGDTVYDRAVGPGQFIPTTWESLGRDGDGDGVADPHDLDDAAASTAAHLCEDGYDIADDRARRTAFRKYNGSGPEAEKYANRAMGIAARYAGDRAPVFDQQSDGGQVAEPGLTDILDDGWRRLMGARDRVTARLGTGDTPALQSLWTAANAPLEAYLTSLETDVVVDRRSFGPGEGTAAVRVDGARRLASVDRWWDGCTMGSWPGPLSTDEIAAAAAELNAVFGTHDVGQFRPLSERNGPGRDPCSDHLQGAGTDHGGYEDAAGRLQLPFGEMAALADWAATRVGSGPQHPFRLVNYWDGHHFGHHVHVSWNPNWEPGRYPLFGDVPSGPAGGVAVLGDSIAAGVAEALDPVWVRAEVGEHLDWCAAQAAAADWSGVGRLVVSCGVNDPGRTEAEYRLAVAAVVERVPAGVDVVWVGAPSVPALDAALSAVGVRVVVPAVGPDGVHPTGDGYRVLASQVT